MRGDPGVIDYLNKALRHELTAINQYWLHYRLLDNWGYKSLAKQWRKESIEEMEHADKLVERVIFLDGFPNMQVLDPLHVGEAVEEDDAFDELMSSTPSPRWIPCAIAWPRFVDPIVEQAVMQPILIDPRSARGGAPC